MSTDFLPNRDSDFGAWLNAFSAYAAANMAALGLVAADVTALNSAASSFNTALGANNTAQQNAQGSRQAKDTARAATEKVIRRYVKDLQNRLTVTDQQRAALGIRVRDSQLTVSSMMVASAPSRPLAIVDNSRQLIHRLRFVAEGEPTRKARPAGVKVCEIWMAILPPGSAAPDETAMKYLDSPSASPYEVSFAAGDAGKTAWYRLRWVNSGGEKSEWSRPVGAMILG